MSDLQIVGGNNPAPPEPSAYLTPFASVSMPIGTPVALSTAVNDTAVPARANAIGTSYVVGVLARPVLIGERCLVLTRGILTLTDAEWNVIVAGGAAGGLTKGPYYLATGAAGEIQIAIPSSSGQFATLIGVAGNANQLILAPQPQQPIPEASA